MLRELYNPITATPFKNDISYMEILPESKALLPYVKCFWVSQGNYVDNISLISVVNPDTCMDIIFNINYSDNRIEDFFCGIDDRTNVISQNPSGKTMSRFAIRFYPWSAILFSDESLKGTQNKSLNLEYHFSKIKKEIEPMLFDVQDIKSRTKIVEKYLIKQFHPERANSLLMEVFYTIIKNRGNENINELSRQMIISNRQLERIFADNTGISPKKMTQLIRYQFLWRDIIFNANKNALDLVYEYGYTDQAHLLNDFKRFHSMPIREAKRLALTDVGFLQE